MLDGGQNVPSVCSILQLHPNTLKRWVKIFVTGGEEALTTLNYVGGDGNFIVAQHQQLVTRLDAEVRSTAEAVAWVEEQFGVSYTDSGMIKLLKRLDYRFKQPDVLPSKADPKKQAEWVETYRQKRGLDAARQGLFPGCSPSSARGHSEPWLDQADDISDLEDQLRSESPQHHWGLFP